MPILETLKSGRNRATPDILLKSDIYVEIKVLSYKTVSSLSTQLRVLIYANIKLFTLTEDFSRP